METITVKINPDGVTAREVNPLSSLPPVYYPSNGEYWDEDENAIIECEREEWIEIESRLRTFEIENTIVNGSGKDCYFKSNDLDGKKWGFVPLEPGSLHQAQIIESNKIRIV